MKKMNLNSAQFLQDHYHPMYLSDAFIDSFVAFYDAHENGKCSYEHYVTLGAENLSLQIHGDEEQEFQVQILNRTRLVVRRVCLKNRRQGLFTAMVTQLLHALHGTPVEEFEVESVLTPEMLAWCRKHDLHAIPGMTYLDEGLGGSYRCKIEDLCSLLYYNKVKNPDA